MEYFDFERLASEPMPHLDLDDASSVNAEITEQDAEENFESLFFDKSNALPADDRPQPESTAPMKMKLINNVEIEVWPSALDLTREYPMFQAKVSCDLCTKMGLDCYLASRGTLVTGCTCCISLFRECSFTHKKTQKGFEIFPQISEDACFEKGQLREWRSDMRSTEDVKGRKSGARFPRDAVKILKQWLSEHTDHPYPNEREKDDLKQLTGLKKGQIANWLANARRRGKVRPAGSGPQSPIMGAIDIPAGKGMQGITELNPLDRWKASPPEHEPASMTAIARAVTAAPLPVGQASQFSKNGSRASSRRTSSEEGSGMSMFRAPSVSSFETAQSSNSDFSFASSRSHQSRNSTASSLDRRRRRRAPVMQKAVAQPVKAKNPRIFQCTFCTDSFAAKYDWQRHEKSLHLALERWTCCPDGGTKISTITGFPQCVFCGDPHPSPDHLETHNYLTCYEKTVQERTFYRKDHLRQHLKLMHGVKFDPAMESWKKQTTEITSKCGFCPSKFTTWQQRADHLAAHFKNGADMSMWAHGWGFEAWVEKLVENAIPPYLIGYERSTMNPYVARLVAQPTSSSATALTRGSSAGTTDELPNCDENLTPDQRTKDSNCWGRLEEELTKYVIDRRNAGFVPSDKEICDYARMTIYGVVDEWDWTCADNQIWLDSFKYQHGLLAEGDGLPPLVEVPVMAPYVIKGGLKDGAAKPEKCGAYSCANRTPGQFNMPLTPNPGVLSGGGKEASGFEGQPMDLDFDAIDFSNLDLGDLGELNFEDGSGLGSVQSLHHGSPQPGVQMGLDNGQYNQSQMMADDVFGSLGNEQSFGSGHNLHDLSGYEAGFH